LHLNLGITRRAWLHQLGITPRVSLHLLGNLGVIVARLGTEGLSSAGPDWRGAAAGTGASGSLLPPWFDTASRHFRTRQSRMSALALVVQVSLDRLMNARQLEICIEDLVREILLT